MIVGDPSRFAIESHISEAYESLGQRALGYFVLHVSGHMYGIKEPDATLLALPFDIVGEHLSQRGNHRAPFETEEAGSVASGVIASIYDDIGDDEPLLGMTRAKVNGLVYERDLLWDAIDEAFDDSSYMIQFDIGDLVRLIALQRMDGGAIDPATLVDVTLPAEEVYGVLREWRAGFEAEWRDALRLRSRP